MVKVRKNVPKKEPNSVVTPKKDTELKNEHVVSDTNKSSDFNVFIKNKLDTLVNIIQNTYLSLDTCKNYDVFSNSSISQCVDHLHEIYESAQKILKSLPLTEKDTPKTIEDIQKIFDKLSILFSTHGTHYMKDICYVVFGVKYNNLHTYESTNKNIADKLEILEKYMLPVGFKNMSWTDCDAIENVQIDKVTDYTINVESQPHLECFEPSTMYSSIHQSVYGLRVLLRNGNDKKSLCINGLMRDVPHQYLCDNQFIKDSLDKIRAHVLKDADTEQEELIERWIESLSVKELLIYSAKDLAKRFTSIATDVKYVKNNRVEGIVKHFFDMDLPARRKMMINLFLYNLDNEVQYIAYMLYDLIGSIDNVDGNDNREQMLLFNTFPWKMKQYFKETMINTIEYTQDTLSEWTTAKYL